MKTLRKIPIDLIEVEFIPEKNDMVLGKLYYSDKYKTASHLCPCGCGEEFSIPIKGGEWRIVDTNRLTIEPSLAHRINCKAHYVIQNGSVHLLSGGVPRSEWNKRYYFDDSQLGE